MSWWWWTLLFLNVRVIESKFINMTQDFSVWLFVPLFSLFLSLYETLYGFWLWWNKSGPLYSVSKKKSPPAACSFLTFFHKCLRILNQYFTHLLCVPIYAGLQIFIQLFPTVMKLCHIKHDYLVHVIGLY